MQSTPEILVLWTRLNAETDQKQELSEIPKKGISDSSIFTVDSFPIYFDRFPHFFWSVSGFQKKILVLSLLIGFLLFLFPNIFGPFPIFSKKL